ncbi:MAG: hypothetical protein EGQ64_08475 [Ruminococcaceae bacterium]|nr:hypothetical protein [Oscillospiraceae bacterium]
MKLFKKLLAVTLVAVLALTVFTACDGSGNTNELPPDWVRQKIYQDVNDGAQAYQETVLPVLYYSADLTAYTEQKLNAYIRYVNGNGTIKEEEEYKAQIKKLDDECKAKLNYVVAQQDDQKCSLIRDYTTTKEDYKKDLYSKSDAYRAASKIGIARIQNGQFGKTYTMIEVYKSTK